MYCNTGEKSIKFVFQKNPSDVPRKAVSCNLCKLCTLGHLNIYVFDIFYSTSGSTGKGQGAVGHWAMKVVFINPLVFLGFTKCCLHNFRYMPTTTGVQQRDSLNSKGGCSLQQLSVRGCMRSLYVWPWMLGELPFILGSNLLVLWIIYY